MNRARGEGPARDPRELVRIAREPAPASTQRERGPDDHGEPDAGPQRHGFLHRARDARSWDVETRVHHRALEPAPVLRPVDRLERRAEHLDAQPVEVTGLRERDAQVETGLTAQRRQQRVRSLPPQDLQDGGGREGLDVGPVGEPWVGHDRGRVRVDQTHLVPLAPEHRARLRPGVVELAGLSDHDRSGADHDDLADVRPARHQIPASISVRKSSKR